MTSIVISLRAPCAVMPTDLSVGELSALIVTVQQSLGRLGQNEAMVEVLVPAVPTKLSVDHDYVVCLGKRVAGTSVRRQLRTGHGLDVAANRARWKLSSDRVVIAAADSAHRSELAKEIGLGRELEAGRGQSAVFGKSAYACSDARKSAT